MMAKRDFHQSDLIKVANEEKYFSLICVDCGVTVGSVEIRAIF